MYRVYSKIYLLYFSFYTRKMLVHKFKKKKHFLILNYFVICIYFIHLSCKRMLYDAC